MSQSKQASLDRPRVVSGNHWNKLTHTMMGVAFKGVWIVLPLLPLSAILLSWLNGL